VPKIWKFPKIFFGWWTVLALGIVGLLGIGIANQSFSVFFKPLSADLGLSRAVTSAANSVQSGVGSVMSPLGGWISDKYGPRRILLIGIAILAIGLVLMFFINSLWAFLLVVGIIGMGSSLGVSMLTDKAIVNWFVKKSGIAVNIKFAIQALAGLCILPVVAWLVELQGWRTTYVIGGIVIAIVCLPLVWFFVKSHRPEHYGLRPDGESNATDIKVSSGAASSRAIDEPESELTLKQATKTSAFWLLVCAGYATNLVMPMMNAHSVPFLTDRGISAVEAATIAGLMLTVSVPARLITGFIVDRLKVNQLRFLMAGGTFLQALGTFIFLIARSNVSIYIWFLLFGIGGGIQQSVNIPLLARYFGRRSFGAIMGIGQPLLLPVGLLAPVLIGHIYDTTGSYMQVITVAPILLAIGGIISCFIIPPKASITAETINV